MEVKIIPYYTEPEYLGATFFKLVDAETHEEIDRGWDSRSDAEMHCVDNGMKVWYPEPTIMYMDSANMRFEVYWRGEHYTINQHWNRKKGRLERVDDPEVVGRAKLNIPNATRSI